MIEAECIEVCRFLTPGAQRGGRCEIWESSSAEFRLYDDGHPAGTLVLKRQGDSPFEPGKTYYLTVTEAPK